MTKEERSIAIQFLALITKRNSRLLKMTNNLENKFFDALLNYNIYDIQYFIQILGHLYQLLNYKKQMVKWNLSLNPNNQTQIRSLQNLSAPFGYSLQTTSPHVQAPKKKQMIENKLWEIATAPKMQLFMTFLIVYLFIGNTLSIYTIFAIMQSLLSSVGGLFKVNKIFQPFEDQARNLLKYKLIYTALNLACLGVISYKLSKMGLLSFSPSAYIDLIPHYEGTQVTTRV